MDGEPLDRFLARRLVLEITEVRRRIQWGRVVVDDQTCHYYHLKLQLTMVISMDGVVVSDGPDTSILVMHKPLGLACSHDPEEGPLIYDIVPEAWRHPDLHSCGRLDRNTSGLLILTCDGHVTQRLAEPKAGVGKRYRIQYSGDLHPHAVAQAAAGGMRLEGEDVPLLPARLILGGHVAPQPGHPETYVVSEAILELREGRHHQVKRMIRAWGGRVVALHRDRIGDFLLPPDLSPGALRPIARAELRSAGCVLPWWR